ncbi:alpha-ribazole phosphatase [Clostridium sp. DL1XJH146]
MNIFLVRHGETEENKKKVYYGKVDADLNEEGILQAKEVGEKLKGIPFDKVYTSERKRTIQTAQLILQDRDDLMQCVEKERNKVIEDGRLNEINFGEFEGKTYKEIQELYPSKCKEWDNDWKNFTPPRGESFSSMYQRVKKFIKSLEKLEADNVLIVTHGGVIRTFYCYIMKGDLDVYWKFSSRNAGISKLKYEYGNWYIESINN